MSSPYDALHAATRRMVPNAATWPHWPVLPLKRWNVAGNELTIGYLTLNKDKENVPPYRILDGNIFSPEPLTDKVIAIFDSVDDLIAAGWVVD